MKKSKILTALTLVILTAPILFTGCKHKVDPAQTLSRIECYQAVTNFNRSLTNYSNYLKNAGNLTGTADISTTTEKLSAISLPLEKYSKLSTLDIVSATKVRKTLANSPLKDLLNIVISLLAENNFMLGYTYTENFTPVSQSKVVYNYSIISSLDKIEFFSEINMTYSENNITKNILAFNQSIFYLDSKKQISQIESKSKTTELSINSSGATVGNDYSYYKLSNPINNQIRKTEIESLPDGKIHIVDYNTSINLGIDCTNGAFTVQEYLNFYNAVYLTTGLLEVSTTCQENLKSEKITDANYMHRILGY